MTQTATDVVVEIIGHRPKQDDEYHGRPSIQTLQAYDAKRKNAIELIELRDAGKDADVSDLESRLAVAESDGVALLGKLKSLVVTTLYDHPDIYHCKDCGEEAKTIEAINHSPNCILAADDKTKETKP